MGRDGWIGVGLLALSGWLYANLHKIPTNPLVPIGPAFYPRVILLLTILLSLILVIQGLAADQREKNKQSTSSESWLKKYRPTFLAFLVFGLYVLLLPRLGYLLSTVMFVTALQWLLGAPSLRRLPGSLVVGVGTSLVTYMVFEKYLHVFLPKGTWFP
jgi:putative tricarboxylic transport membrane protein